MKNELQTPNSTHKRMYSRIPLKKKISLIKFVFRRGVPLDKAIEQLGLKKTTAVNIIKRYQQTGSLPMRKFKKARKNEKKEVEVESNEDQEICQNMEQKQVKIEYPPVEYLNNFEPPIQYPQQPWFYFPVLFYGSL